VYILYIVVCLFSFLSVIVLSVLRLTDSDYSFGIFFKMGLKILKTQELQEALPSEPPPGLCPWTLLGGLGSPQTPGLILKFFLQMPLISDKNTSVADT
jgi:hypothetical protein